MPCRDIMVREPRTVAPGDSVPTAVQIMLDHGMRTLPVVDADGRFLGSFTSAHLIGLLLPQAARFEGGLGDLAFVHDGIEDLRDRLEELRTHEVGDYMESEHIPMVGPDTSIPEAMRQLYRSRSTLPVVDPATGKLVGVVTFARLLLAIRGR